MFETADMETRGQILSAIASLVDAGEVRTTLTERFSPRTSSARTRRLRHYRTRQDRHRGLAVMRFTLTQRPPPVARCTN
jgi:hypothetical protein